jgi:trimeric autotransporter adhesin
MDGSSQDITGTAGWSAIDTTVATITSKGVATGISPGSTTVVATMSGINGSSQILVTPAVLVTISVSPGSASITPGATQQFIANGSFSDGTNQNVTTSSQWSSSIASVATISNSAATNGVATATGSGVTAITAKSGALTGNASLTVASNQVTITEFPVGASTSPSGICKGPDGALWFTEEATNRLGRLALDGTISEWTVPTVGTGLGG